MDSSFAMSVCIKRSRGTSVFGFVSEVMLIYPTISFDTFTEIHVECVSTEPLHPRALLDNTSMLSENTSPENSTEMLYEESHTKNRPVNAFPGALRVH